MGNEKKNNFTETEHDRRKISYFQIYRYASWCELCAIMVGVLFGLLSGGGVCYNLVQLGELSTSFVERTTFQNHVSSYLPLISLFGGGRRLFNASRQENMAALQEDVTALAYGMLITLGLSVLCNIMSVALIGWSALRQITKIRLKFLKTVLRQDMSWYDTNTEFNLASKMSEDLMKLKEGMGEKLAVVSNLIGTAILCICTAVPLGWELALACLVVMPFSISASIYLSNYQTKSSLHEMESYSQAGKQAEEILKSIRTVVAFGGEDKEANRYRDLLMPAERYGRKRGLLTGLGNGFNWVLTYSLNAIGLTYGTRLVLIDLDKADEERNYVTGTVFSVLFLIYMATQSITLCVPHAEVFASARGAAASIFKLLDRETKIDGLSEEGIVPRRAVGDIRINDVCFSYPSRPELKVLKGFSLHIKQGECVALVGSSGCGKSTILQLLQRLYDPQSGTVNLDGRDIKTINVGWLRSSMGVVGQEPVLFRGTIHHNIAIGCPEATRQEVEKVAAMAYAHDFISRLPNGYDTVIGERGASLSGGQKQRIAIARSLLRDPAVLLLDEPTSALDPYSEKQVQAALDKASVGRTTIMVSHRLSTIVNCDRIICMDQGVIVEEGIHSELLNKKGFYYKLVRTGKENTETDEIEPLLEESECNEHADITPSQRSQLERGSTRQLRSQHSIRDLQECMAPRSSISSVMSAHIQNHGCNTKHNIEQEETDHEEEKLNPVSDWDLLKLNGAEWMQLTIGSIAAVTQGACFPIFALLFGYTSAIFAMSDRDLVIYRADLYSGLFLIVAAVAGISMCLQSTTFTSAGLKMTTRLRYKYFEALLRQEIGYFDRESNTVGALCSRLSSDTAEIQGATGLRVGIILQGLSSVLIGFLMAVSYSWKLTLVATAFLPLMVGSIWFEGKISNKSQQDERKAMEAATSISTEAVSSIKTVQSLGIELLFLKKFHEALKEASAAVVKKSRFRGLVLGMGIYVPFLSFGSAIVYGTTLVVKGEIDYKTVLLVNEAIMYGAYMLGQSLVYAPGLKSAKQCVARILATIQRVPVVKTEVNIKDQNNWVASGSFSLNDLEFRYPTRRKHAVIKGINLKVEAGKTVALVGSSGCGKSTILQLMQRFYDPDTGSIKLDNLDIRTALTLPRLRQQLGVVQQEPVLFDRTIAENIAYGDNYRKVAMHEIVAAAKAANIHTFIVSLSKGYDTNLGANGAQLSGGQKQRICIARALVRSPRLLLLDEATSALDANSEKSVTDALDNAAKGRTCVTIAHRLSTIKYADIICVLHKGTIVESGTHAELVSQRGYYWRMSKEQNVDVS